MVSFVRIELSKRRNDAKAEWMQKYLKTDMPFYGLQKPARAAVERNLHAHLGDDGIVTPQDYRDCVEALWALPHREEKYLAIDLAMKHTRFITPEAMDLYESMLRQDYMWWDLVDPVAIHLVGGVAATHRDETEPILRRWIQDQDCMWIRRTAILAQLMHRHKTNETMLLEFCRLRMHEKEFFIRKAIGWALRQHSRYNPQLVKQFLTDEKQNLSGLSYREGAKRLVKIGMM